MKSLAIAALLGAVQAKCPAKMTATIYSDAECKNVVDSAVTTKAEINKWTTCQKVAGQQEAGVIYTCTETGLNLQEFKNQNCAGTADKAVTIEYNKCREYSNNKNPNKLQYVKLAADDEMDSEMYPPKGNGEASKGAFDPSVSISPEGKDNSMALKATAATLLALAAI